MTDERRHLIEALAAVRRTGQCNMVDRLCVFGALGDLGYTEAATWLWQATPSSYLSLLLSDDAETIFAQDDHDGRIDS